MLYLFLVFTSYSRIYSCEQKMAEQIRNHGGHCVMSKLSAVPLLLRPTEQWLQRSASQQWATQKMNIWIHMYKILSLMSVNRKTAISSVLLRKVSDKVLRKKQKWEKAILSQRWVSKFIVKRIKRKRLLFQVEFQLCWQRKTLSMSCQM